MGVGCQSRRFNCLFWRETRQRILGHEISPYPEVVRGPENESWRRDPERGKDHTVEELVAGEREARTTQLRSWWLESREAVGVDPRRGSQHQIPSRREVGVEEWRGSQHQTPSREARRKIGSSEKSLKMSDPSSIVEFSLVTHASDSPYIYYQECICM